MNSLPPPDSHYVNAASGWIGLGNPVEAAAELEKVSVRYRLHPDVLQTRWEIAAKLKQWETCCEMAQTLTKLAPDWEFGWVHYSFALHELKRTSEAKENLLAAVERFPKDWLMRYNLACYDCQLGDIDGARKWLRQAMKLGSKSQIEDMAASDPDLEPLRKEAKE